MYIEIVIHWLYIYMYIYIDPSPPTAHGGRRMPEFSGPRVETEYERKSETNIGGINCISNI